MNEAMQRGLERIIRDLSKLEGAAVLEQIERAQASATTRLELEAELARGPYGGKFGERVGAALNRALAGLDLADQGVAASAIWETDAEPAIRHDAEALAERGHQERLEALERARELAEKSDDTELAEAVSAELAELNAGRGAGSGSDEG